jgi:hypothetical protein
MRSGSTLLLHILLTNPDMIGAGERQSIYRSHSDLDKLAIHSRIAQRAPFRRVKYAVDQINHDQMTPNIELLRDERVRCIFLIRDPKETIQSIVRTFYVPWTVHQAVDYYTERLQTLARYATSLGSRMESMTYNELLTNSSSVLRRLEAFLGLNGPLREEYAIQRFTGRRGDPSNKIREGRIVRDRVPVSIEIPDRDLARARYAYDACVKALRL